MRKMIYLAMLFVAAFSSPAPAGSPPAWTSPDAGNIGTFPLDKSLPSIAFKATGGTGAITYAVAGGMLPVGTTLSPSGILTGTPTAARTFNFTISATDAQKSATTRSFSIRVTEAPIWIRPDSGNIGLLVQNMPMEPISFMVTGAFPPVTCSLTAGTFPPGLSLSSGALLSGTPTSRGKFNFMITATNSRGMAVSRRFSLQVTIPPTWKSPAAGTLGNFSRDIPIPPITFRATNSDNIPVRYHVISGALPPGLSLSSAGILSGTPNSAGTFAFTIRTAINSNATADRAFSLTVKETYFPLTWSAPASGNLGHFTQNTAISPITFKARSAHAPITYSLVSGPLPPGLSLSPAGILSGTPDTPGSFNFTIRATDTRSTAAERSFNVEIYGPAWVAPDAGDLGGFIRNTPIPPIAFEARDINLPMAYAVSSGILPPGLALSTDGILTGIPDTAGTFAFGIRATDTLGASADRRFTIRVASGLPAYCWGGNILKPVRVDDRTSEVMALDAGNAVCLIESGTLKCLRGTALSPLAVEGLDSGVTAVASGHGHTCAIQRGALKCWGSNFAGQLGNGKTEDSANPATVIGMASGVTAVAAGSAHTCAIQNDTLKCWGMNHHGQLGNGTTAGSPTPVVVSGMKSGLSRLAAGGNNTCAIKDGGLKCWGMNLWGELGNGTLADGNEPVAVTGMDRDVTAASVGNGHICAIAGGGLKCWGNSPHGELGGGAPVNSTTPVPVPGAEDGVTAVAAGSGYTCFIRNGGLSCQGQNNLGQLGNGTIRDSLDPQPVIDMDSSIRAVVAGENYTCALRQ